MGLRNRIALYGICVMLAVCSGLAIWLTGCATIIHGTSQDVSVTSKPSGAIVTIDNMSYGKTPVVASLSRGNKHTLKVEAEGYEPFEMAITKSLSGWVWGNIIFGGLIGLAIDAISGGMYNLTPDQVMAELDKEGLGFRYEEDSIFLTVVLRPDPEWQEIAILEPLAGE